MAGPQPEATAHPAWGRQLYPMPGVAREETCAGDCPNEQQQGQEAAPISGWVFKTRFY